MPENDDRLRKLEERLTRLEEFLKIPSQTQTKPQPTQLPAVTPPAPKPAPAPKPLAPRGYAGSQPKATTILGWGGVAALVLATIYLIRLAIDSGWLTPERQVVLAALFGLSLIAAGFILRGRYPRYASLLPAGGIVALFITNYGAHVYHHLINAPTANIALILICLGALVLRQIFESDLYAIFSVVGSFTGPLLLSGMAVAPYDLIIYFCAWSVLYSVYAIIMQRRFIYLLAAYLVFVLYHFKWSLSAHPDFFYASLGESLLFLVFVLATVVYSIRNKSPLTKEGVVSHLPALIIFYLLQYWTLTPRFSDHAPLIAFASAVVLVIAWFITREMIDKPTDAGRLLITMYGAFVLLHAGYADSVPVERMPWVGFGALVTLSALASVSKERLRPWWPLIFVAGLVILHNVVRLSVGWKLGQIPVYEALFGLYALIFYAAYWMLKKLGKGGDFQELPLYLGHLLVMSGAVNIFDSRLAVSLVWGILAIVSLSIAIPRHNRMLGRSALVIFAGSAVKVVLFDLSGAAPLIRIGCLVVLGVTLYAGGLLYQRIDAPKQAESTT